MQILYHKSLSNTRCECAITNHTAHNNSCRYWHISTADFSVSLYIHLCDKYVVNLISLGYEKHVCGRALEIYYVGQIP